MKNDVAIYATTIDGKAVNQIYELSNTKAFLGEKIRIMPDCHPGEGCVIGFTSTFSNKIIPNIVGVDLYCGMLIINLGKIDIDLEKVDNSIKKYIPMGRCIYSKKLKSQEMQKLKKSMENMHCYNSLKSKDVLLNGVGSLGGGNHFIEIDVDDDGNKYLVIHSGSRNLGAQVAKIYQNIAVKECKETLGTNEDIKKIAESLKKQNRQEDIPKAILEYRKKMECKEPSLSKDFCYLEGESMQNYLDDILVCKDFANMSRRYMAQKIIEFIFDANGENKGKCSISKDCSVVKYEDNKQSVILAGFETLHNYVDLEMKIIRKGAIRALNGEKVLIPINMRDGSLICTGKGNEEWNMSAPHGSGRLMSRSESKEKISLEEFKETMKNVYSTSVGEATIDESPFVYKSMEEIVKNVKDTVIIDTIIRPIYNCKASDLFGSGVFLDESND